MINNNKFYLLFSIIAAFFLLSCELDRDIDEDKIIKIGIINPGPASLPKFASLVENKVIKIDNLQFLAICFETAERDFERVEEYIAERDDDLFRMHLIGGDLLPEDLFKKNDLSEQFKHIFSITDGLFFLGGADFPPITYNEKTSLLTDINTPNRHYFELSFLFQLLGGHQDTTFTPLLSLRDDYVVVGFCLGMQSMNAATGGSMYQDIPLEIYEKYYVEDVLQLDPNKIHRNYWQKLMPDKQMIWANFHKITPIKSHHLFDEALWQTNPTPSVYSSHHQAVKDKGLNIDIVATSLDHKVPEIITHLKFKNVFGVQFHPEVSLLYKKDGEKYKWFPEDTEMQNYYNYLQDMNSLKFHLDLWSKISGLFKK